MNVSQDQKPPSAIITGAGTGIGRAIAIELSRLGYTCLLVGRNPAMLNQTSSSCPNSSTFPADITHPDSAAQIVAAALQHFGRIDALINNAGYAPVVKIENITPAQWRQIIDTNLSAAVYLAHACWPTFRKQNAGAIINISSESSRDPFMGLGAYGAAKAGLNLLTKALAAEGADINVKAHAIAPAAVETEMFRQIVPQDQYPTEKTLSPEALANLVADCLQGNLRHTNGEVIYVHK
jgi:NAD(P)-dependent dehydrogenase (short-subunit alcohol dehydrogenase family)